MVLGPCNHWFRWFTMVVHHWSDDGMVTYHRWSLPKTQTLRRTDSLFRKIKKMRQGSPSSSFTAALRSRGIKIWWLFFDICGIFGRPMVSSKFTNPPSSLCSNLDFWDKTSFWETKLLIGSTFVSAKWLICRFSEFPIFCQTYPNTFIRWGQ